MNRHNIIKENLNLKVVLVSVISSVFGLYLSYFSFSLADPFLKGFLGAIGTTIASIGLISLAYDLILRRSVQNELISLVGIQADIQRNQINGAGRLSEIDWKRIINDTTTLRVYLVDPLNWIDQNWTAIAHRGNEYPITFSIFMPDPDDDPLASRASSHLNIPLAEYKSSLKRAARTLEDNWKNASRLKQIRSKSSLKVTFISGMPLYGVVTTEKTTIVLLDPPLGRPPGTEPFYMRLEGSERNYPREWLLRHLSEIQNPILAYENEVD